MRRKKSAFRIVAFLCLLFATVPVFSDILSDYSEAKKMQASGDYYGAMELYRGILNENPSFGEAWKFFAECAYAVSEYELCLSCTANALTYRNDDPALHNLKAFTHIGLGKLEEARSEFLSVLAKYPNDVQARFGLAELDVADGKTSAAADMYRDALLRQPENRKALLSLAAVSIEMGNDSAAETFINQALKFHGGSAEVLYFAGHLAAKQGKYGVAENRLRSALSVDPSYTDAAELLVSILYSDKRYREAIAMCDTLIAADRTAVSAWYVKARALEQLGEISSALALYDTAVQLFPEDSILRTSFEFLIQQHIPLEDSRRKSWAAMHTQRAADFEKDFYSDQALFEYRRSLKIDPYNTVVRKKYADLLLRKGWPVRYLEQLTFTVEQGLTDSAVSDDIESYTSLLQDKLYRTWNVSPNSLDAAHISVGLYYKETPVNLFHLGAERTTALLLADVMSHDGRVTVSAADSAVPSFSEAFKQSRKKKYDYFVMTAFEENSEDVKITLSVYSGRTGSPLTSIAIFRTGSDRYYAAIRRAARTFLQAMPFRAVMLQRKGMRAVIDRGHIDGVATGQIYTILRKNKLTPSDDALDFKYNPTDIVGTFTVTIADEDISEGTLQINGFYDKVDVGDDVIRTPEQSSPEVEQTPPNEPADAMRTPALLQLLRSIE